MNSLRNAACEACDRIGAVDDFCAATHWSSARRAIRRSRRSGTGRRIDIGSTPKSDQRQRADAATAPAAGATISATTVRRTEREYAYSSATSDEERADRRTRTRRAGRLITSPSRRAKPMMLTSMSALYSGLSTTSMLTSPRADLDRLRRVLALGLHSLLESLHRLHQAMIDIAFGDDIAGLQRPWSALSLYRYFFGFSKRPRISSRRFCTSQ